MGILTVKIIKASNLADKDGFGKTDPYVKLELEQDNFIGDKDYGHMITSTKSNDCNPVWDEEFNFTIPTLNNMVLSLKLMDADIGRDDKAGSCKFKLEHEDITSDPKQFEKTIDFNLISRNGTITVDISYNE